MSQEIVKLEDAVELALKLSLVDRVRLVEQVMATVEHDLTEQNKTPKRSLLGLWSGVSISEEDIDEIRSSYIPNK